MKNMGRMLLMSSGRGNNRRDDQDHSDTKRMRFDYEVGNRFRDRDGREHYDDGRFAPQNNYGYDVDSRYRDETMDRYDRRRYGAWDNYEAENRFRDSRGREHYDNGRYAPQSRYDVWSDPTPMERYHGPRYDYRESSGNSPMGYGGMNLIGFNREDSADMRYGPSMHSDATMPQYNEMERRSGNIVSMQRPETFGDVEFTPEIAKEWTSHMKNEDGSTGPHWSMEQVEKLISQRGLDCDPYQFWAVMNAIYSDDVKVAKKHNVNTIDYYVDRTLAWLNDKDAVKDKAAAYFEYIVKH